MAKATEPRRYSGGEIARICVSSEPGPNVEGTDRVWMLAGEVEAMVLEDAQIFQGLCVKTRKALDDIAALLEDGGTTEQATYLLRELAKGFEHPAEAARNN